MNNYRKSVAHTIMIVLLNVLLLPLAYAQKPEITAVETHNNSMEQIVTLKGSDFGTDATKLAVFFGPQKARIVSVTNQILQVTIPAGTTYQHISVTNTTSGLTGYSHDPFLISFSGKHPFTAANLDAESTFSVDSEPNDHCLCDFDNDGLSDIATSNSNNSNVSILKNTSVIGGAISFAPKVSFGVGQTTLQIKCGDLNGDGRSDLVVTEATKVAATDTRVFIIQNNGGSFSVTSKLFTQFRASKIEIADLDRDGKPEVLITNQIPVSSDPAKIMVLINDSNGPISFTNTTTITIPTGLPSFQTSDQIVAQDLNGDNFPEIITTQFGAPPVNVAIVPNTSTPGSISFGTAIKLTTFTDGVRDFRLGDLDGDGKQDIAVTGVTTGNVAIYLNNSSGSTIDFRDDSPFPTLVSTQPGAWGIDLGDMDGDGKVDIVVGNVAGKNLFILNNESSPGSLAFSKVSIPITNSIHHVRLGDLNGDGKPDVSLSSIDKSGGPLAVVTVLRNKSCVVPKITPSESPISLCTGQPYKLTATLSKGSFYQWFADGVAVGACTKNNNTFTVAPGTGNKKYTVKIFSEGASCATATCGEISNEVEITANSGSPADPNASVAGPVCTGSELELLYTNVAGAASYKWTGPEGFSSTVTNPTKAKVTNFQLKNAGWYYVDVIFAGNCIGGRDSVLVSAREANFQIFPTGPFTLCEGAPAKVLSVAASADFNFQWKRDGNAVGTNSNTFSVATVPSSTGDYTLTATPKVGVCNPIVTFPVEIAIKALPTANFSINPATACANEKVTISADPNTGADYAWNFGDSKTGTGQTTDHIYTSATGSPFKVTLIVSYGGSCPSAPAENFITITAAPSIAITTTAPDYNICDGESIPLHLDESFTNPVWSSGESNVYTINATNAGKYSVTAKSGTCNLTAESSTIVKFPATQVIIAADPASIDEGQTSQLTASGLVSYQWTPAESLSQANIENPVATPLASTSYTVSGIDANGCAATAAVQVVVIGEAVVNKLIPHNFFSPNNSGPNEQWLVEQIDNYPQCGVSIYDEKGVKVYFSKPYGNDWDGTYNGKPLPDGVYFYLIRCDGEENSPRTGSITLIR